MDRNPRPPAPPVPAVNPSLRSVQVDSQLTLEYLMQHRFTNQQTRAMAAPAVATAGPAAQRGVAMPWSPNAVMMPGFNMAHQHHLPKLTVFRPPAPRPDLHDLVLDNVRVRSFPEPNLCVLNMQADPPSPDSASSMEEEEVTDDGEEEKANSELLNLFPLTSDLRNKEK